MSQSGVAILGVFVADLTFRASRLPAIGETMIGSGFASRAGRQGIEPGGGRGARGRSGQLHLQDRQGHLCGSRAQDVGRGGHHAARDANGDLDRGGLHLCA